MVSWTIGLVLLCVCGPYLRPSEAAPIKQEEDGNERSYKRELELFTNEVQDSWEHDDNEYLSRRELEEERDEEKHFLNAKTKAESDTLDKTTSDENTKRWLDVDSTADGLNRQMSSPAYEDEMPKDGDLFQEDIVMDNFVRQIFNGEADKRDVVSLKEYYWRKGILHYKFDPRIDEHSKEQIMAAIEQFRKHTCIKFREIEEPNDDVKDYVLFISDGSKCYSNVGRRGGMQKVSIGYGCYRVGTPIHEIMHVLGFFHEMARLDRDKNVRIHWENIKKGLKHNFRKMKESLNRNLGVEYNTGSVLHYSNKAFSKNGDDTITSIADPSSIFGQRYGFSNGDVLQINKLYNCSELNAELKGQDIKEILH